MLRRTLLMAVLAALSIAACGGSGHSSSATSTAGSGHSSSATSTAGSGASRTATATVSAGGRAGTGLTATTSSRPPEVPRRRAPKHSRPTAPNTDVRIPAAFTIGSGGVVTPPLISAPANVTIELQLHNEDSRAHRVRLSVARLAGVAVPARGSTTTKLTGVGKGTYRLLVDGAAKARIVVGAVPGP